MQSECCKFNFDQLFLRFYFERINGYFIEVNEPKRDIKGLGLRDQF